LLTVGVSFLCAASLLATVMPLMLAYTLASVFLIGIEIVKRLTFVPALKDFYQFQKIAFAQISVALLMLALSCALSWNGTHEAVTNLSEKPILNNIDSATLYEKQQIVFLQKQIQEVNRLQVWKGKLTEQGQTAVNNLLDQTKELQNKVSEKETVTKKSNLDTEKQHFVKTNERSNYAKYITILFDLLLFGILAWLEYYDYRSITEFASVENESDTDESNNENRKESTVKINNDTNENRKDLTSNDVNDNNLNDKNSNVNDNDSNVNGNDSNVNGTDLKRQIGFHNKNNDFRKESTVKKDNKPNDFRKESTVKKDNKNNENRKESTVKKDNKNNENRKESTVKDESIRVCLNCDKRYTLRHHKQKYCCDECRVEFWENENGRKVNKLNKKDKK
jgi:hypothetical protein